MTKCHVCDGTGVIVGSNHPKCRECGRVLQFSFEAENGNLCAYCGPGSAKYEETAKKTLDSK